MFFCSFLMFVNKIFWCIWMSNIIDLNFSPRFGCLLLILYKMWKVSNVFFCFLMSYSQNWCFRTAMCKNRLKKEVYNTCKLRKSALDIPSLAKQQNKARPILINGLYRLAVNSFQICEICFFLLTLEYFWTCPNSDVHIRNTTKSSINHAH